MTAAELWSKAGREIEGGCNLQTGTEQTFFKQTQNKDTIGSCEMRKENMSFTIYT